MARNHVPPPDAASAPNVAPGREFWADQFRGEDVDAGALKSEPPRTTVDSAAPNLTRLALSDQLYGQYLAAGNDDATARALASARALVMVP